jgi:peptide/nickel transport system permease protein
MNALLSGRVLVGAALILFVSLCAMFAPLLASHDPGEQDLLNILLPPAWSSGGDAAFPLGTDSLGRDQFARLLYGARLALLVAVTAACGAAVLGTVLAHIAGYFGGFLDWLIGRAVEVWMSFPPVILSLILMVGLGTCRQGGASLDFSNAGGASGLRI